VLAHCTPSMDIHGYCLKQNNFNIVIRIYEEEEVEKKEEKKTKEEKRKTKEEKKKPGLSALAANHVNDCQYSY